MSKTPTSLDNAPAEIKLAVDLIYLLEDNAIDPQIVLSALDIVRHDFEKKLQSQPSKS
ncbi:pleiotropic regulatory protein RsmS [Photobacterium sp. S4TG1]|uniref:pleiotropic regulatory protein RsmS n=1 Tax=Photobacterium sp. S4TG1 TaxID=3114587 RepID=UPI002E1880DF|nr:pleiotropic regulatory protein RsmS [Photobacterium sp. S4TG1]